MRPVCAPARGLVRVHPEDGIVVLRGQGLAGLLGQTEQPGRKRVGQTSGVGAGQHGHTADVAGRVARRQIDQVSVPHAVVLKVALVVAADDQAVAVGQLDGLYVRGVIAPGILPVGIS